MKIHIKLQQFVFWEKTAVMMMGILTKAQAAAATMIIILK